MTKGKNDAVSKIKKLSPAELKKQSKNLDGQFEVNFTIGNDAYAVMIDEHFRKTKIFKLIDDVVAFYDEANKFTDASMLELATPYSSLLVIKHFTDIEIKDDIDDALAMLDVLIDLELLDKILNAMPEQEIIKVYELLNNVMKNAEQNLIEAEKEAEKIESQIENVEVKGMLQ